MGGKPVPTIKQVENQIRRTEGFQVRVRYAGPGPVKGRDVRGDRTSAPHYPFTRRRSDEDNVAAWIEGRFRKAYSGYDVDVLDASNKLVHGGTKLRTVRATYVDG